MKLPSKLIIIVNFVIVFIFAAIILAPLSTTNSLFYVFIWGIALTWNPFTEKMTYARYKPENGFSLAIMILTIVGILVAIYGSFVISTLIKKSGYYKMVANNPEANVEINPENLPDDEKIARNIKINFGVFGLGLILTFISLLLFLLFVIEKNLEVNFWAYIIIGIIGLGIIYCILGVIFKTNLEDSDKAAALSAALDS
ncbi:MAG: hypothetical protein ACTSSK_03475 [Candidatus Heimdallarchaeota archaeon]